MTTKTEYFKLQRRPLHVDEAPWEDVTSTLDPPDLTLERARETYDSFVESYEFHKPGRYEFRTVYVTVKTTEKPMVWGK